MATTASLSHSSAKRRQSSPVSCAPPSHVRFGPQDAAGPTGRRRRPELPRQHAALRSVDRVGGTDVEVVAGVFECGGVWSSCAWAGPGMSGLPASLSRSCPMKRRALTLIQAAGPFDVVRQ